MQVPGERGGSRPQCGQPPQGSAPGTAAQQWRPCRSVPTSENVSRQDLLSPPAPRPAPRRAGIQRASGSQGVNLHPVARGWLFGGVLGGVALEVAGKRADKIRSFLAKFGGGVGRGPPSSPAAPLRSPSSLRPQLRRRRWTARCRCGRPGGCAQARAGGPGSRAGRATSMRGPPTTGRPARRWRRRPRASPTTASDAGASEPPEPRRRRPPRRDWPPARRPRCTRATPRP